jgi:hypothetical protein
MRGNCTSGSVRGGGGNVPTYSAGGLDDRKRAERDPVDGRAVIIRMHVALSVGPPVQVELTPLDRTGGRLRLISDVFPW